MDFSERWISLIFECMSSARFSFRLNGDIVGNVVPTRGLRQGCPLSPYLFLLCAEAFSGLLKKAEAENQLIGLQCSRFCPRVSHLFFADDSLIFCRATTSDCSAILSVLSAYAKASGQAINLDKSSITFSPNVADNVRAALIGLLGLPYGNNFDKYLGLPAVVGRQKRATFANIKERVWKKIQGWKHGIFSAGGKEVLIKSVLQAIPTYVMSLFELPTSLCNEIRSLFIQFWWGNKGDGKRNICWISWAKMCRPKCLGGLGFRDLGLFNRALVAKQAWRLLSNPNSLAGRVLKGKYFHTEDFLSARVRGNSSFLWKSLIWGRDTLSLGLRWRVGNGSSIRTFTDAWLPRPHSFRPITAFSTEAPFVSDLLLPSGSWNSQKILSIFHHVDSEVIMSIPRGTSHLPDRLIWHFEKNGCYSVKSGYRQLLCSQLEGPCSSSNTPTRWWNSLWNVPAPPKVKIFTWRLFHDSLPSKLNLANRNVMSDVWCMRCGAVETIEHAIFWCFYAKEIWNLSGFGSLMKLTAKLNIKDALLLLFRHCSLLDRSRLCCLMWLIWWERNKAHFGGVQLSTDAIIDLSHSLLNWVPSIPSDPLLLYRRSPDKWKAPPAGKHKHNTDAAVVCGVNGVGFGAVIRDNLGCVIAATAGFVDGFLSPGDAEAFALREGLLFAKHNGIRVDFAECDCLVLVNSLTSDFSFAPDAAILEDISSLLVDLGCGSCHFIPREGNEVAHKLAAFGFSSRSLSTWTDCIPLCIDSAIRADLV